MKRSNIQKKQLVDTIAREYNLRANQVHCVVNAFLTKILDTLGKGDRIEFRDFGVFEVVKRKAKVGRDPKKAEVEIRIPERNVVKFTPGKKMKMIIAQD